MRRAVVVGITKRCSISLLGRIYGGDGRTTFGLPDLRGRMPMQAGSGPGLTPRQLGEKTGTENVTLTVNQLPSHSHRLGYHSGRADATSPVNNTPATSASGDRQFAGSPTSLTAMSSTAVSNTGGSRQHNNMSPFLCIHFIIALIGIFPSRN